MGKVRGKGRGRGRDGDGVSRRGRGRGRGQDELVPQQERTCSRPSFMSQLIGDRSTPLLTTEQCEQVVHWIAENASSHLSSSTSTTLSSTPAILSRQSDNHIPHPDLPSSHQSECPQTSYPTVGHSEELFTFQLTDSSLSPDPLESGQQEKECSDVQIFEQPRSDEGDGGIVSQEVDNDETQLSESQEEDQDEEVEEEVVDDIITDPT